MEQEALERVTLVILGRVQGVFFRASALEQAQGLSVTGTVKNLADGSVELVAEGARFKLEQLVEWCRRGPPEAEVEEVIVRWGKFRDEFRTFMIER